MPKDCLTINHGSSSVATEFELVTDSRTLTTFSCCSCIGDFPVILSTSFIARATCACKTAAHAIRASAASAEVQPPLHRIGAIAARSIAWPHACGRCPILAFVPATT